jgi:hypothetical protein
LNNKSGKTFVVFSTMNSLSKDLDACSLIDWKNVLSITFKAIVFIYDQKSFNNLVVTLHEKDFKDDISMVYKFYQASLVRSSSSWMNLRLLIHAYLCPSQEGKST